MNLTKLLLGTICGALVTWLIGGLFFLLILKSYFAANVGNIEAVKDPPLMWAIILGCVFFALLITFVFLKWANITTLSTGLTAGASIGLLFGLACNMFRLGDSHFFGSLASALVDALVMGVMGAGAGAVIGWILGRK